MGDDTWHEYVVWCDVCKEPVPKSHMEEHMQKNRVEIQFEKCFLMVGKDFMDDHLDSECSTWNVYCDICDLDYKINEYESHVHVCSDLPPRTEVEADNVGGVYPLEGSVKEEEVDHTED